MWNKIGRIVMLLAKRLRISPERAFDLFYTSETNQRLHDSTTLLYTFGDMYIVEDVAQYSEDDTELVIYRALYGNSQLYARPMDMFLSSGKVLHLDM